MTFLDNKRMAAILDSCHGRKARSQENLQFVQADDQLNDNYVLDLLSKLPPSRDLLRHYQVTFLNVKKFTTK